MRRLPLAEMLRVRAPCDASWDEMTASDADARVRRCGACANDVHDVSLLTRAEAEALLRSRREGERLCFHLHVRRSDGAILLADGHAMPERPSSRRAVAVAMAAAGAATLAACAAPPASPPMTPVEIAPVSSVAAASAAPVVVEPMPVNRSYDPPAAPPPLPPFAPPPPPRVVPDAPIGPPPPPVPPSKAVATKPPPPARAPATPAKNPKRRLDYDTIDGGAW